ncbi:MAG TPA: transcription termination/antitermination NusG family protein [Patescibacteria group bacterium]|nr:transcription termination/antitermination NusG family protein [Patescibacteria group bacterium]
MKETASSDWFIVSCKPKQEFDAERNLRTLDIGVYLPVYNRRIKKNKTKVDRVAPLFSGYLFARFDIHEFYQKVKYTKGVKTILGYNEYLWTIADEKIRDIQSRENNGLVVLRKREESFSKGDKILIDEGDFEGWEGIFQEELPDRERAIIMLTNVKFSSKLILPKKYLIIHR